MWGNLISRGNWFEHKVLHTIHNTFWTLGNAINIYSANNKFINLVQQCQWWCKLALAWGGGNDGILMLTNRNAYYSNWDSKLLFWYCQPRLPSHMAKTQVIFVIPLYFLKASFASNLMLQNFCWRLFSLANKYKWSIFEGERFTFTLPYKWSLFESTKWCSSSTPVRFWWHRMSPHIVEDMDCGAGVQLFASTQSNTVMSAWKINNHAVCRTCFAFYAPINMHFYIGRKGDSG